VSQRKIEVRIEPNLDFSGDVLDPSNLVELLNARSLGAPLLLRPINEYLREKDLTQLEFDDELAQMADEDNGGLMETPLEGWVQGAA